MKTPVLSSWFGRGEIAAPPDIASATLRSDRFRLEREGEWRRLEAIVASMERGGLKRIADEDLLALPALYRTAASSLAVARETSLDAATLAYLEALVQRAWFQVYGPRRGFASWLREFLLGGWSRAVRAMWLDICIALLTIGSKVGADKDSARAYVLRYCWHHLGGASYPHDELTVHRLVECIKTAQEAHAPDGRGLVPQMRVNDKQTKD